MDTTFALRPFNPAWWLPGPHAQTLGGRWLRSRRRLEYTRERFATPDGDFLDVDFAEPLPARSVRPLTPNSDRPRTLRNDEERPIILLLHGLEGCSDSGYVLEAASQCVSHGFRAAALNFRGRSGTPNRQPRAYHAGETGDLAFVLEALRERSPKARFAAIGFSLGGNVLLKYLGESARQDPADRRDRARLLAAAAISVPYDLEASTARMERGWGKLYARYFLRSLRAGVRAKADRAPPPYDRSLALKARTLRQFDEAVTAPLHGFRDAADYYQQSSSLPYLGSVSVPTLLLHARDDPFMTTTPELEAAVESNVALRAAFPDAGGHVGFVEGAVPWKARFWAAAEAVRFLSTHLGAGRVAQSVTQGGAEAEQPDTKDREVMTG